MSLKDETENKFKKVQLANEIWFSKLLYEMFRLIEKESDSV